MGICRQLKDEIYRCPPDPGARRPSAGRLAGHLVAGRRRRRPPHRRHRARPDRHEGAASPRSRHVVLLTSPVATRPSGAHGHLARRPVRPCWPGTTSRRAEAAWAMEQVLSGAATSAQLAGVRRRAAGQGGVGRRGGRPGGRHARARPTARLRPGRPAGGPRRRRAPGATGAHTVNISTMSALVCAAAGAPVVKHGNRAASSSTGTADVLEQLGVAIDLGPEGVVASVRRVGIGFCFAQTHHPAMRHAGPTRRELGVPTVFNILGPLTNPGGAPAALIGCANPTLAPVMADVLHRRGVRALVVRGEDGLDEISTAAPDPGLGRDDRPGGGGRARRRRPRRREHRPGAAPRRRQRPQRGAAAWPRSAPASRSAPDADRVAAIRDAVAVNASAAMVAHAAAVAAAVGAVARRARPDDSGRRAAAARSRA